MWQPVSGDDQNVAVLPDRVHPVPRLRPEVRRVLFSTNAIELLNVRCRRATKAWGHYFPSEHAALKCLYLVILSLDSIGCGQ